MPYIAIKAFPKDKDTKEAVADRVKQAFLEIWGCPPEAITISIEEVKPENWEKEVVEKEIKPNLDKMLIISGEKTGK